MLTLQVGNINYKKNEFLLFKYFICIMCYLCLLQGISPNGFHEDVFPQFTCV